MVATSSPVEPDSMASYSDLPAELILQVGGLLEKKRHLATLAELNRFSRDLITPRLYALHASEAVRWSADQGDLDILQAALRHTNKSDVASLVNQKCNWNYRRDISPLAIACFMGHTAIVSCLLDHGARIDEPFRCDVHCSVHFETSVPLARPTTQWLPLQAAIFNGHTSTALLLLERGAPLHVSGEMRRQIFYENSLPITALQSAVSHGMPEVVRHIRLAYGHYLRKPGPEDGFQGHRWHLLYQRDRPADELASIKLGLNPDHVGGDLVSPDRTLMYWISRCRDYESACATIRELQEMGLSVDGCPGLGNPLDHARSYRNSVAARALLEAGAKS